MTTTQSARLERKKLMGDPIMVTTIVVLITFLTLFILYPLAILLVDSFIRDGAPTFSIFSEILALGKKSCISVDNGITWGSYKSKFAPTKAIAIGERIFTVINSKVGTVLIGGEFVYGKKNKFKGIAYSKENSEVAGGLLPYTTLAEVGGKPAALYITPDNKQVSFTTL